jgi:hypothetical protein
MWGHSNDSRTISRLSKVEEIHVEEADVAVSEDTDPGRSRLIKHAEI